MHNGMKCLPIMLVFSKSSYSSYSIFSDAPLRHSLLFLTWQLGNISWNIIKGHYKSQSIYRKAIVWRTTMLFACYSVNFRTQLSAEPTQRDTKRTKRSPGRVPVGSSEPEVRNWKQKQNEKESLVTTTEDWNNPPPKTVKIEGNNLLLRLSSVCGCLWSIPDSSVGRWSSRTPSTGIE